MLVRTHMQDLKDVTRETHYENYRAQCIQSMTRMVVKERNRKYAHAEGREKYVLVRWKKYGTRKIKMNYNSVRILLFWEGECD